MFDMMNILYIFILLLIPLLLGCKLHISLFTICISWMNLDGRTEANRSIGHVINLAKGVLRKLNLNDQPKKDN
jgi:hypothetical protein